MPTKNPRLNITVNETEARLLSTLAKQQNKSISSLAKELILEALDRHEDVTLSKLAGIREKKAQQTIEKRVSHEDAWK